MPSRPPPPEVTLGAPIGGGPLSGPPTPPVPHAQRPDVYGGIPIPLDPMLAAAGAFYNERGELVRAWKIHAGPCEEVKNASGVIIRRIQRYWTRERHVAPPGMPVEVARARGLDFYSPHLGWIRAGVKREQDYPDNLGTGHLLGEIETVEVEVAPNGESLPETARVSV